MKRFYQPVPREDSPKKQKTTKLELPRGTQGNAGNPQNQVMRGNCVEIAEIAEILNERVGKEKKNEKFEEKNGVKNEEKNEEKSEERNGGNRKEEIFWVLKNEENTGVERKEEIKLVEESEVICEEKRKKNDEENEKGFGDEKLNVTKSFMEIFGKKSKKNQDPGSEEKNILDTKSPCKFMSWNANSFYLRLKNDRNKFFEFVKKFDPDVIAIQEVRLPAGGGKDKIRSELKDDTNAAREEKQILTRVLNLPPLSSYCVFWSLADTKYAGTAVLLKKRFNPVKVSFNLDDQSQSWTENTRSKKSHDSEGRIILIEFSNFFFLNTYAPNNGWKEDENGFIRRQKWDSKIKNFVLNVKDKSLIWCGDLNVSHTDLDVSHPEFFRSARQAGYMPPDSKDLGQPGFTPNEQKRFSEILEKGGLLDSYRLLHPERDTEGGFTWSGNPVGKYRGKRMRIDYFLISKEMENRLISSKIHGRGIEMQGFLGSDHCPITMELKPSSPKNNVENDISQLLLIPQNEFSSIFTRSVDDVRS